MNRDPDTGGPQPSTGVLILNTDRGAQSGASGYARIGDFLPGAIRVSPPRRDPVRLTERIVTRLVRLAAANEWYRIGSLKMEWQALRHLRNGPVDVVHILWGDQDWGYIHHWLPEQTALVVTLHNPPDLLPTNFPRPEALARVDRFILMSPDQSRFLQSHGIGPERWAFVPHGIDTDAFCPGPAPKPKAELAVLHVGNYLRNFQHLARVTRELEDSPVRFHVVCSQANRDACDYGERTQWHHQISDGELLELYRSCDVLLMTASGATANNAVLEGMACGLPVVAEDVGGLGAYLDGRFAILADPADPAQLGAALLKLLHAPELRRSMAVAAREQALAFSWPNVARMTAAVYQEVIAGRRRLLQDESDNLV